MPRERLNGKWRARLIGKWRARPIGKRCEGHATIGGGLCRGSAAIQCVRPRFGYRAPSSASGVRSRSRIGADWAMGVAWAIGDAPERQDFSEQQREQDVVWNGTQRCQRRGVGSCVDRGRQRVGASGRTERKPVDLPLARAHAGAAARGGACRRQRRPAGADRHEIGRAAGDRAARALADSDTDTDTGCPADQHAGRAADGDADPACAGCCAARCGARCHG